jgi:release factor glutamine methyltransferase
VSGPARPAFHDPVEPPPAGTPWTVLRMLRWSTQYLAAKGVEDARLDMEHLLAHTLGTGRLELYLHFERPLTRAELDAFRPLLLERARRKPLQYIVGRASFRELELAVDPRVLIPRPETEELVEAVLVRVREWGREGLSVLDVGTGSGAVVLALLTEGPFGRGVASDHSSEALEVARTNARTILSDRGVALEFREGDLLEVLEPGERFDVVVSNPPYVAESEHAELAAEVRKWEPRQALVAPEAGLAHIRRLVQGAPGALAPGGLLALEVGSEQAESVAAEVQATDGLGAPVVLRDLSRRDRIVLANRLESV